MADTKTNSTNSTSSQLRTLEQLRAENAWNCIKAIKNEKKQLKEYKSWALKVPTLVQTNGLGQTLAFLNAKGDVHNCIGKCIETWLLSGKIGTQPIINWDKAQGSSFLEKLATANSETYRHATTEAMAWLVWFKRFAEGELSEPEQKKK